MNRNVNVISNRLSLRKPQRDSLEILADIADLFPLKKGADTNQALAAIRDRYSSVTAFDERDFPSLCFALATGVGKTRLMGAFVAYLHLEKKIRHFFVLAPNLTIYNKLIADFQPGHPKYVLQGIAEFAVEPPEIITGDNYESGRGVRKYDLFGESGVHINIFNISKINSEVRGGKSPRIKRLQEYIGQSYFDYLAGLDDLVLLQDESHRYRASAGIRAINELHPILGLELTATPQVEHSSGPTPFGNVIYSYPLSRAMDDGFVKEPVVATRANFKRDSYNDEELQRLKLEDGIQVHERAKVDLEVFAREHGQRIVKPFILVIARDTNHANELEAFIKRDDFFEGRYKDRVITVHSNQSGEEKDEVIERLLAVEDPKEPTEIVIHVNMLKEGWDVTNLYTIIPLRAAKSETLVQQSIGRGLRLPYGKRTGVKSIDRLTIIAHDHFQEILDDAKNPNSPIHSLIRGGITIEPNGERREVYVARSAAEIALAPQVAESNGEPTAVQQAIPFPTQADQAVAQTTLDVIRRVDRVIVGTQLTSAADLKRPEVMAQIVKQVQQIVAPAQTTIEGMGDEEQVKATVEKAVELWVEKSMDIPRIVVVPNAGAEFGYSDFDLDIAQFGLPIPSQEILLAYLRTDEQERLNADLAFHKEKRLEDYIVRRLIEFDDISYDDQADLLYKLAGQMVAHIRTLHSSEDDVFAAIRYNERKIAELIHAQMQSHIWTKDTGFEVKISQGVTTLRENNYTRPAGEAPVNLRAPVDEKQYIRSILFGGFRKCLYQVQKFDSDPERRFAVILENDPAVEKWFKPAKAQFQIFYRHAHQDHPYEPDFCVETKTEKLLCEPKRASEVSDEIVQAKAAAAIQWCQHASANGGKPWSYVLIPHDVITAAATLEGLLAEYRVKATATASQT